MIAILALVLVSLAPQEAGAQVELARLEPAASSAMPDGCELRLHDASDWTGHRELESGVAALRQTGSTPSYAHLATELRRLENQRAEAETAAAGLLATLRDFVEPPIAAGQLVAHLGRGQIALFATPEQHACVARFLPQASAYSGWIQIETRIYVVPRRDAPATYVQRSGLVLGAHEAAALQAALMQRGDFVLAPTVLVKPLREARLSSMDEVPYVKDFEVKVIPGQDSEILDPVVDIARSGVDLRLRSAPMSDGGLAVYIDMLYSKLTQPMRSFETRVNGSVPVMIQLPEIVEVKVGGRFELRDELTLYLSTSLDSAGDDQVIVLIQAHCVPADQVPEREPAPTGPR
ncbi:MAG: hypothetical protein HOP15_10110 [Planctomycetes bacterium]|nr:hypothetical protein [Planctomycetota bacterium]